MKLWRLAQIIAAARRIHSSLTLDSVLNSFLDIATGEVGATGGSVYLRRAVDEPLVLGYSRTEHDISDSTWRTCASLADEAVFWNPRKMTPIYDYDESGRAWDYVHKKTGIRRRNQYQTRHSFASNLAIGGTSLYKIGSWMGHNDPKTTQIYSHLQEQDADIERL